MASCKFVVASVFAFLSICHGQAGQGFDAWARLGQIDEHCGADIRDVKSPIMGLRFHDLRHHAITELAESQTSDSTIMSIAGHVSSKMLAHYSHVRLEAKRSALDALCRRAPSRTRAEVSQADNSGVETKGYDTNNDTKRGPQPEQIPQVLETMVELVGIEPTTSSLRTMRSPS